MYIYSNVCKQMTDLKWFQLLVRNTNNSTVYKKNERCHN